MAGMDRAQHIAIEKDDALQVALDHAAALKEPGTSEAELLRYLALVGSENLPEPYTPPTPEQLQRSIDFLVNLPWNRETPPRSECGPSER